MLKYFSDYNSACMLNQRSVCKENQITIPTYIKDIRNVHKGMYSIGKLNEFDQSLQFELISHVTQTIRTEQYL